MSDIAELRARARELGIKVDRRWSPERLAETIAEVSAAPADDGGGSVVAAEPVKSTVAAAPAAPVGDGWPRRVAPTAWIDQDGRRYNDLAAALRAAERCRRRR